MKKIHFLLLCTCAVSTIYSTKYAKHTNPPLPKNFKEITIKKSGESKLKAMMQIYEPYNLKKQIIAAESLLKQRAIKKTKNETFKEKLERLYPNHNLLDNEQMDYVQLEALDNR